MSQSAARSFGKRETLEVDAMIENEIRELERKAKADIRSTAGLDNSTELSSGYGPPRGGGVTLRDSLRSSFGGIGGSLRNSIEGLDNAQHTRRGGGVSTSMDTLGSTGIRALLMPEFRLDGKKEAPGNDLDVFLGKYNINMNNDDASASAASTSAGGEGSGSGDNELKWINSNMDDLMNLLTGGDSAPRESASFFSSSTPVSGSLVAHSIPDITAFLGSEMHAFEQAAKERQSGFDVSAKDQSARDNRIREEGRAEARAMGLFGINHVTPRAGASPADRTASVGSNGLPSTIDALNALTSFLGPEYHASSTPAGNSIDRFASAGGAGSSYKPDVPGNELAPVQQAIDNEMVAADEILYRMRALRTGLGSRLRRLDALHAEVMTDKDSGIYVPPSAAAARAPAMLAAASGRPQLPHTASGNKVVLPATHNHFGTGADVPPPALPERVRINMQTEMADKVAHTAQTISSTLTVTMEGMVNRISDNHKAVAAREPDMDAAVPAVSGNVPAPTSSFMSTSLAYNASSAPSAPIASVPTVALNMYGETQEELRLPAPEKSLLVQLNEMDGALGAEGGPGAPVGLDKFLPHSTRVQNALVNNASHNSTPHTKSSVPSPFRTSHWAPPPTLYKVQVPVLPSAPAVQSSQEGSRFIMAPSDEELWMRSLQDGGQTSLLASAPFAAIVAPLPTEPPQSNSNRKLPWQTSTSDHSALRIRPVEGTSMLYDRTNRQEAAAISRAAAEQERVASLAAAAISQYSSFAQNNANRQNSEAASPIQTESNDRQDYLRRMQAIRQGMAMTSF